MARQLHIGLTGGIASGKTTVGERFIELGVPVIDADDVARAVVVPGSLGLDRVVKRFGRGVLTAEGSLDRRTLRNLVFSDAALRKDLEGILHPLIRETMDSRVSTASGPYVVLSSPLLLESKGSARVDRILVIDVDEQSQLSRVMTRDSCSAEQASAIIAAQASRDTRLKAADDVLVNSGSVAELRLAVDALHGRYLHLAASMNSA